MTDSMMKSIAQERALLLGVEIDRRSKPSADFTAEQPTVMARRPQTGELVQVQVGWLKPFPNLRDAAASALVRYFEHPDVRFATTRRSFVSEIQIGLLAFLASTGRQAIHPWQLDRALFSSFIRWLNERTAGGGMRKAGTKRQTYLRAHRLAALMLQEVKRPNDPEALPPPPWKVRESGSSPEADVMPAEEVRMIVAKCADIIRDTSQMLKASFAAIEALDDPGRPVSERTTILRALAARPPEMRNSRAMSVTDRRLLKRMRAVGLADLYKVVLPSLKDVLPFIVMLVVAFRLNDSVVRSATLDDFRTTSSFGGKRLVASPFKARKGGRVLASVPVTSDPTNPSEMISLLDRWLAPLRSVARSDRLFVFWTNRPEPIAMTFENISSDNTLSRSIRRFAIEHDLPHFTLTRLRKTMLDLAHERSGGDLMMVRAAASHASVATTDAHYVSRAGRRREEEKLAAAMRTRQLGFLSGNGAAVPEGDGNANSCTPGWLCAKPGATPFHAPRVDGLCVAYGRCPVCVHGSTNFGSERCARLVEALVEAIDRSMSSVDPASWLGRLSPIRRYLIEEVLPQFPDAVVATAIAMPALSLPELD